MLATPEKWAVVSSKWSKRKAVKSVSLFVFDELQLLGEGGGLYEVVVARARMMQAQTTDHAIRILGLSASLANYDDMARWLGVQFPQNTFNFDPSIREVPLDSAVFGFDQNHKTTRVLAMAKPCFNGIKKYTGDC